MTSSSKADTLPASPPEKHLASPVLDKDEKQLLVASGNNAPVKKEKPLSKRLLTALILLSVYTGGCIALAVSMKAGLDGYKAIDSSTHRLATGHLRLRVSDVTTLISAAIVLIKFFGTSWAVVTMWLCARELIHQAMHAPPHHRLTQKQLSFMVRYKVPPWLRPPFGRPRTSRSWIVAFVLLCALPQPFIAPLLSGAVDWNPVLVQSQVVVNVQAANPEASLSRWSMYNDRIVVREDTLRQAAGYISMAWTDQQSTRPDGSSRTGNGCRHVVNDDGLPSNTTLLQSVLPCLQIHSIDWVADVHGISDDEFYYGSRYVDNISITEELLHQHTSSGRAFLYDADNLAVFSSRSSVPIPEPVVVSGLMTLAVILGSVSSSATNCDNLRASDVDIGPLSSFSGIYRFLDDGGHCYIFAHVNMTAGQTTSARSIYITPRVVEDQTRIPGDNRTSDIGASEADVAGNFSIESSPWTQHALWMLPNLMTTLVSMNSTRLANWDNINMYAENLIRQSYLAAWDSLSRSYDTSIDGVSYVANPPESRVEASVSAKRTFSWLAVALLHTVGGLLLVFLILGPKSRMQRSEAAAAAAVGADPSAMMDGSGDTVGEIMSFLFN